MELLTRIITRNDSTAKWLENSDQVLLKGEMAIEFTDSGEPKIKVGDGTTPYAELKYFGGETAVQLFEVELGANETHTAAITRVVGDTEVSDGAFAVVKAAIAGGKSEYTAYIYSGDAWKALDGNYNAENVYFDKDLLTTSAIGNIVLNNGQATIAAQGKNLKQLFDTIFVKEKNPTITPPSVTVTSPEAKAYEVGAKVTPTWSSTFNVGKYEFGPATGVTVESWAITDTAGNTATTKDGSFPQLTVGDNTSYKITSAATYTGGVVPVTNVGNAYASGQIKAGTATKIVATAITGYRNSFYGTMIEKKDVDSAAVRALSGKSNKALANGAKFNVAIPVGALRVVIAYPATLRDITSISDVNGMGAEIKSSFSVSTVTVEGANGFTGIDYKVYTMDFANANDTANTFAVTI